MFMRHRIGVPKEAFTKDEIKKVIWNCDGSKSPEPDSFSQSFFKAHWDTLKYDLMNLVKEFEIKGRLVKGCNSTFITLIPKLSDPLTLSDYRPISLVASYYKIIAKVLSERLKQVLPSLISENQTAFVANRQITDGILLANEVVSWAKRLRKKLLVFKVDFAKAFDCVNWGFLDSVMDQKQFSSRWRKWIM